MHKLLVTVNLASSPETVYNTAYKLSLEVNDLQKFKRFLIALGIASWLCGIIFLGLTFYVLKVLASTTLFFICLFLDFIAFTGIFTTITLGILALLKKRSKKD